MTITVYLCFFVLKNNSTIKIIKKGKKRRKWMLDKIWKLNLFEIICSYLRKLLGGLKKKKVKLFLSDVTSKLHKPMK